MSNYTPGPWHVEINEQDAYVMSPDGTILVAECTSGPHDCGLSSPNEALANAALLAAAPELLDALQDMVAGCEMAGVRLLGHDAALAAIAKAKGETP